MRILGAILAGGQSRRFGSDKASALLEGVSLIDHVRAAIAPQVADFVLCGRQEGLADRPAGSLGPLAGLNAALHFGRSEGYDAVLSVPCDTPFLPTDLADQLRAAGAPSFVSQTPVIGLWPCPLADRLDLYLEGDDRSMRGWARQISARAIDLPEAPLNINRPTDMPSD